MLSLQECDLKVSVQLCILWPIFEALDLITRKDHQLVTHAATAVDTYTELAQYVTYSNNNMV